MSNKAKTFKTTWEITVKGVSRKATDKDLTFQEEMMEEVLTAFMVGFKDFYKTSKIEIKRI